MRISRDPSPLLLLTSDDYISNYRLFIRLLFLSIKYSGRWGTGHDRCGVRGEGWWGVVYDSPLGSLLFVLSKNFLILISSSSVVGNSMYVNKDFMRLSFLLVSEDPRYGSPKQVT